MHNYRPRSQKTLLKKLIRQLYLQDNIEILDPIRPYTKYISILKASKVFVLPSTREGFSITTLEANATGLPVITFRHPLNAACDLILNGYNGYKIPPDTQNLAKQILHALQVHKDMKRYCRRIATMYDWNNIVILLEKYYRTLRT